MNRFIRLLPFDTTIRDVVMLYLIIFHTTENESVKYTVDCNDLGGIYRSRSAKNVRHATPVASFLEGKDTVSRHHWRSRSTYCSANKQITHWKNTVTTNNNNNNNSCTLPCQKSPTPRIAEYSISDIGHHAHFHSRWNKSDHHYDSFASFYRCRVHL